MADFCAVLLGLRRREQTCETCGRDRNTAIHEGFNGFYIDEKMACPTFLQYVPEEYMRVRHIPVATDAAKSD